jgi:hypothetical protein
LTPIEEVLPDFITLSTACYWLTSSMPMSVIFNLDDDNFDLLNNALLQHVRC